MNKSVVLALLASAAALATVPAHAGNVSWSVGINLPVPRLVLPVPPVFVSAPVQVYAPEPAYAPGAVYYQREPAYPPEQVYYQGPPVYVRSAPVVYPRYDYSGWRRDHDEHRDHDRDHHRWEGRGWHHD